MGVRLLLITIRLHGVSTTSRVALPLAGNGVLAPRAGEKLANIDAVKVEQPVFPVHPPVTIVLERVVQLITESLVLVPLLVFVGEGAIPLGTGA